jgi:hypothetical protein
MGDAAERRGDPMGLLAIIDEHIHEAETQAVKHQTQGHWCQFARQEFYLREIRKLRAKLAAAQLAVK